MIHRNRSIDPLDEARHSIVSASQEASRANRLLDREGVVLVSLARAESMLATALEAIDQETARRRLPPAA
jgi:hypothetical protein